MPCLLARNFNQPFLLSRKVSGNVFNQLQGTRSPEFAPGEAEEIVKQIRREIRAAESKQNTGDMSGAARADRQARDTCEIFRRRLSRIWDRQIRKQIPFASEGEREDAIADLQLKVIAAVMNTDDSLSALHWERRFNQCVQRRAIDICRPIQKKYGYGESSPTDSDPSPVRGPREIHFSALDKNNDASGSESRYLDRLSDTGAEKEIERMLGAETLRQLIDALGEKDRNNLRLWWRQDGGETWEQIGQSEGLKPDTVRKRAQAVLHVLRKVVGAETDGTTKIPK